MPTLCANCPSYMSSDPQKNAPKTVYTASACQQRDIENASKRACYFQNRIRCRPLLTFISEINQTQQHLLISQFTMILKDNILFMCIIDVLAEFPHLSVGLQIYKVDGGD